MRFRFRAARQARVQIRDSVFDFTKKKKKKKKNERKDARKKLERTHTHVGRRMFVERVKYSRGHVPFEMINCGLSTDRLLARRLGMNQSVKGKNSGVLFHCRHAVNKIFKKIVDILSFSLIKKFQNPIFPSNFRYQTTCLKSGANARV